jgi:hypothetical protein
VLGSFWDLFPFLSFPFSLFCFWVCEGGWNFINPNKFNFCIFFLILMKEWLLSVHLFLRNLD